VQSPVRIFFVGVLVGALLAFAAMIVGFALAVL
jgi:hypothetical protein